MIELLSGEDVRNRNRAANMARSSFYVCPVCGNVIRTAGEAVTLPAVQDFGFLTALTDGLKLEWDDGEIRMKKGESFFLPCKGPALYLSGNGDAALSMPRG